ncbi:zinc-finger homeodomain protein 1-like [Panicum virgatum]|uniref:zinc-finger homeodomain protein 1-like n=1 Tax=Panicum virgatum TaxID=38727 RepID=UPI0019D68055|nr:zinc-finger homeodomain protein 1-like [Panicum virgatum]
MKRLLIVRRCEPIVRFSCCSVRYGECRRNHAASTGGYTIDGCREFIAEGEEGTGTALKCTACGCHRSFHRRVQVYEGAPAPPPSSQRPGPEPLPPPAPPLPPPPVAATRPQHLRRRTPHLAPVPRGCAPVPPGPGPCSVSSAPAISLPPAASPLPAAVSLRSSQKDEVTSAGRCGGGGSKTAGRCRGGGSTAAARGTRRRFLVSFSLDFFSDMHPRTFDAVWHSEACRISSGTLLLRPIAVDFFKNRQRESRSDS